MLLCLAGVFAEKRENRRNNSFIYNRWSALRRCRTF